MTGPVPPIDLTRPDPATLLEDEADGDGFSVGEGPRHKHKRMLPNRRKAPSSPKPEAEDARRPGERS